MRCLSPASFLILVALQHAYALTSGECKWACTYAKKAEEASLCSKCAENPPINYELCYHACGRVGQSNDLDVICHKCFYSETDVMNNVCRLACRNKFYYPNVPVCATCDAKANSNKLEY